MLPTLAVQTSRVYRTQVDGFPKALRSIHSARTAVLEGEISVTFAGGDRLASCLGYAVGYLPQRDSRFTSTAPGIYEVSSTQPSLPCLSVLAA